MKIPKSRKPILFLLSVDTEEEFNWDGVFPQQDCSIENIQCLPRFQAFCERLGIRPTYLVDYPVANDETASKTLKNIVAKNTSEVGAHLHPWCTPPLTVLNGERESHVVNLSPELVSEKLQHLTTTIKQNIGVTPTVFRTGRWGINGSVLKAIGKAGYVVDSSILPFYENSYFSCSDSINTPYWPDESNTDVAGTQRTVFEIPVTAGFNRKPFRFWGRVHRLLELSPLRHLHLIGLAWQMKLLRKIYLSPELASSDDMLLLINAAINDGHDVVHMYLHSSSLLAGQNSYAESKEDVDHIYQRIEQVISALTAERDIRFCTLSESASLLQAGMAELPATLQK
ncbi:polysaccharide deacetylase family protein [Teredinibacter purpureus]|uniref:polysaccharide deacetylase family protein n=1 Tax=Teredinibacter purpureus TaxID=2731756 RepID=UPI000AA0D491|nr:polysaccharide deacetylase family protein [Teredinibacter purpureus]